MNILITGGTGFIGSAIIESRDKDNFIILSRKTKVGYCQDLAQIADDMPIDIIINLAGARINKRWNQKNRQLITQSRLSTTENIGKLIARLTHKPKLLLSASAIGYYGSNQDEILYENSEFTLDFTHDLCEQWENLALNIGKTHNIPVAIMRFGVVMAKHGGAYPQMTLPIQCGLGGVIGTGKQYISWIHLDDAINAVNHLINYQLSGIFNITAPEPITNSEFTKIVAKRLRRPSILKMPANMVRFLFGEMGEALLLNGQRVYPQALLDSGFEFKYKNFTAAIKVL